MKKGNLFKAKCLSRVVLDLLAEKWALLVIHSLSQSSKRTAELRRHIEGISEKMLIQTLRSLERHGFVARRAFAEVPPRVEYRLTPLGERLSNLVNALDGWVEDNYAEIIDAQRLYDREKAEPASRST